MLLYGPHRQDHQLPYGLAQLLHTAPSEPLLQQRLGAGQDRGTFVVTAVHDAC